MAWGDIEWFAGYEYVQLKNDVWQPTGRARIEPGMSAAEKQEILNGNYIVDVAADGSTKKRFRGQEENESIKNPKINEENTPTNRPRSPPLTNPPAPTEANTEYINRRRFKPSMEPTTKKPKVEEEKDEEMAMAQAGGSGVQNNETAIKPYSYVMKEFFPQTLTVKLPVVFYMSANAIDKVSPVLLILGLNSPYNILTDNTLVAQTEGAQKAKGLSNCNSKEKSTTNFGAWVTSNNFPTVVKGSVAATTTQTSSGAITHSACVPARLSAYQKIYQHYATLQCDYSIEMEYGCNNDGAKAIVFYQNDTVTNDSELDKAPQDKDINYMRSYPNMSSVTLERRSIAGYGDFNFKKTIRKTWRPGMLAKDTRNAEEIKTWNNLGAPPANKHRETEVLFFYGDWYNEGNAENCINMRIFMEWTVQLRDLKNKIRYPHHDYIDDNLIVHPDDFIQTPYTTETTG